MSFDKVIWKEGMLLKPQHFQQNDRHMGYQLRARTQLLSHHGWGLFDLEVNTNLLDSSKLSIIRVSGVMPDGTLFEVGRNSPALVLSIPQHTHDVPVYLALPLLTGTHKESRDPKHTEAVTRYLSCMETLNDSHTDGKSECQSLCAKEDFRLLLGKQPEDSHFVTIKLGQLIATSHDDRMALDARFIPTYLHFNTHTGLKAFLLQVLAVLANRGDKIAARMRSKGQIGGAEVGDFLMLQLINRYEARLQHALHTTKVHPEEVYLGLLELLAELTTFASEGKRTDKRLRYDHSDQAACLRLVTEAIGQILGMVLEQHALQLLIGPGEYGIQAAVISDKSLYQTSLFILVATAHGNTEKLRSRLPDQLKVGSVENIRQMINLHLPGFKVAPLPVAPRQLPYHPGKAYFRIELETAELEELMRSGGLGFHLAEELSDIELELWAIKK